MATKILPWFYLGCLELLSFASCGQTNLLDCGPKATANTYLDIASEMIRNAKETYFACPHPPSKALDCGEILNNGHNISKVYRIWPKSRVLNGRFVDVFCDMDTDGGGWTVIQRRGNYSRAKDYFFQDWQSHKNGFGKMEEDFWLGNDNIYAVSNQGLYSIRFDLKDVEGDTRYAQYDTFWIDDEDHKYTLHIKGYSGDAGPQPPSKALDCGEILNNGQNISKVYQIWPKSRVLNGRFVDVFCDMDTDGGGWTVIQRRGNYSRAKDYFFQDWQSYKNVFGKIEEDFWLGNDNIYAMSNQRLYSIRFDMKDVEGNKRYAQYDTFWIDDEDHKYTIHIKGYNGDAGDSMIATHDDQKFSTKDQDNDASADISCSQTYKGGWWYGACHASNLNGLYLRGKHESSADGVNWHTWKGHQESLDTTEIKIRQKDFRKQSTSTDEIMTPE